MGRFLISPCTCSSAVNISKCFGASEIREYAVMFMVVPYLSRNASSDSN